ncbi:hypothetical protein LCGC14_1621450 [marine sediment metagenome]|uniref:Uncharacterized protein n=1 Tax=marine sediment metagenome TaxID=412755 RepID=A0A0F9I5K7_9ZZZZ
MAGQGEKIDYENYGSRMNRPAHYGASRKKKKAQSPPRPKDPLLAVAELIAKLAKEGAAGMGYIGGRIVGDKRSHASYRDQIGLK